MPVYMQAKEDYVRFMLFDLLNDMVEDYCPVLIELD